MFSTIDICIHICTEAVSNSKKKTELLSSCLLAFSALMKINYLLILNTCQIFIVKLCLHLTYNFLSNMPRISYIIQIEDLKRARIELCASILRNKQKKKLNFTYNCT